jgi:preprotein translocase subunit SecY
VAVGNVANIAKIPELRKRILFSLALLAVYRVGVFITTPGVNRAAMRDLLKGGGGFLGLMNMFSGGALEQLSIFALGIMPYISASIILQLLTVVVPALERLQKEGQQGQKKINQYTRYGTIVLSMIQAFFIAQWLEKQVGGNGTSVVVNPGFGLSCSPWCRSPPAPRSSCGSASRSPSAASATASRSSSTRASWRASPRRSTSCSRNRRGRAT